MSPNVKDELLKVYPHSKRWVDSLTEAQATAIYLRLKREGRLVR